LARFRRDADTVFGLPALSGRIMPIRANIVGPPWSPTSNSASAREAFRQLLISPMKEVEVAGALDISTARAKIWLRRLVDEGVLEKRKEPGVYIARQSRLFD
jgi:hypothetical protein